MKSSRELREEIAQLSDRVLAICEVAEQEGRDLTAEEREEIDRIQGRGAPGQETYVRGQIAELEEQLDRVQRIEARARALAESRAAAASAVPIALGEPAVRPQRIVVPAQARTPRVLRAFHGHDAQERAYLCGQWILATIGRSQRAAEWCREHGVDCTFRAALRESANEVGGFLVPPEFEQAVIDRREQYGVFRRYAQVVPMSTDTLQQPKVAGGVTAYWVAEENAIAESEKKWDSVSLVAKKIAALVRYSTELSEDAAITIADDLAREFAYAFAKAEDLAGFVGDGTSTYGGIVGVTNAINAGSIVTADTGDVSFETLDLNDFEKVIGKFPNLPNANPMWFISKPGWAASMLRLLDAAGGNTAAMLAGQIQPTFLGYPVVFTNVLNSTLGSDANQVKCIFGDLRLGAMIGDRRGITVTVSADRYFEYDQLAIRGTQRVDINVHDRGTSTDPGVLIALKTAAS